MGTKGLNVLKNVIRRDSDNVDYGEFAKYGYEPAVYRITCKTTKKSYIGSTQDVGRRLTKHFSELRFNRHTNHELQNDFNLYGYNDFRITILKSYEGIDVENWELASKETMFLKRRFEESGTDTIYNEKISGIYMSDRLRKIHASSSKDTHKTEEYRNKMIKIQTRYSVAKYDIYGNFIESFKSIELVKEQYPDYAVNVIRGVCNGSKKSYKGYIWKYIPKLEDE